MSTADLTGTSYALLGLLAVKPFTTYELTQQMDRGLNRYWPRAQSKLYEEPKKLAAGGYAKATSKTLGKRASTVYSITAKGRRALATWLASPGQGPVLEFENLLKVFFAENGTKHDLLATLAATAQWAETRTAENVAIARGYREGTGPFPSRQAQALLVGRFLADCEDMVARWAAWATAIVETWPDDIDAAQPDTETLNYLANRTPATAPSLVTAPPARRPRSTRRR
jgi:PadR family transcriptional regulator, regulatory protein AphA